MDSIPEPTAQDREKTARRHGMAEASASPSQPSERDRENAAVREALARKQAEEYGQVLRWALGKFGPGWLPSGRHYLLDHDDEARCRRTGERPVAAATVY